MTVADLVGLPWYRFAVVPHEKFINPHAVAGRSKGIIYVDSSAFMDDRFLIERWVPNTRRDQIVNGDLGALMLDDGNWVVVLYKPGERMEWIG